MPDHKKYDVLCAGIAAWDTIFTGVDRNLLSKDSILAEGCYAASGGDAVNAAVSMARLGMNTAVSALLGNDSAAKMIMDDLEKAGVHTEYLRISDSVNTASPVLLVDPEGERHIIRVPDSGNHYFTEDMVSDAALESAKHLHFASANVMERIDGKPLGILFERARRKGLTTSLDVSYDREGSRISNIEDALQNCDIFIPSMQEASVCASGSDPEEICRFFSAYPLKIFGIKLAGKGVLVTDFHETFRMPSLYEGVPVDTTGAGDAFLAGFVSAWLKGYDLPSCAAIGSAQSASVIGAPGASRSAGTWEMAETLCRKKGITLKKRT